MNGFSLRKLSFILLLIHFLVILSSGVSAYDRRKTIEYINKYWKFPNYNSEYANYSEPGEGD